MKKKIHYCVVFELMGCSLYDLIQKGKYKKGLPFDRVIEITKKLLLFCEKLHQNEIIHGDVKPENILLDTIDENYLKVYNEIVRKENIKNVKKYITNRVEKQYSPDSDEEESIESFESENSSEIEEKKFLDEISLTSIQSDDIKEDNIDIEDSEKYDFKISDENILNSNIKIADLGTCCFKNDRKKKKYIY